MTAGTLGCGDWPSGDGFWREAIAEAAEVFDVADVIDCGRAVEIPETASVLDVGQMLLAGRFRADQSPFTEAEVLFVCVEGPDAVDVEDAEDAREDDEFDLWVPLRGSNIRDMSSASHGAEAVGCSIGGAPPIPGYRLEVWGRSNSRHLLGWAAVEGSKGSVLLPHCPPVPPTPCWQRWDAWGPGDVAEDGRDGLLMR